MLQNSSIRPHEDFSLTGNLLEVTNQWHKNSYLGSLGARVVNATCTPFTALIDTVAHLALGTFTVCGGSFIAGSIWNLGILLAGRNRWSVLRFEGGLINLANALHHAIGMVAIPIIGFFSPEIAAKKFKGCQNAKIEDLREQSKKIAKQTTKIEKLKKNLDSVKQTLGNKKQKITKLEKNHTRNTQSILTLKNDIIALKNDVVSRDDQLVTGDEKNAAQGIIISKLMAELQLKNQQLAVRNHKIVQLEEDLKEQLILEYPNNDIEHEEEMEALNLAHAEVIKSHEEELVALNLQHAKELKSKDLAFNNLKLKSDARGQTIIKLNTQIANLKTIDKSPEETPQVAQGHSSYATLSLIGGWFLG